MKLLSFLKETHRDAANAWLDANVQAGPNTYASMYTKSGDEALWYCSDWVMDEATKDTVVNYLETNFPGDYYASYYDNDTPGEPEATKQSWGFTPYDI